MTRQANSYQAEEFEQRIPKVRSRRKVGRGRALLPLVILGLIAATLSSGAAVAGANNPPCASADSDSDGDGWGYENGVSCIVVDAVQTPTTTTPPAPQPDVPATCPATPFDQSRCEYRLIPESLVSQSTVQNLTIVEDDDNQNETEVNRFDGGFRTRCLVSHFSYSDPLVHPNFATGTPTAAHPAHLHMFFGNTSTGPSSTNELDEQSDPNHLLNHDSTCGDLGEFNKSAYWIPALFNVDNEVVVPDQINVYYKVTNPSGTTYSADDRINMRPIPNDLQLVASNGHIGINEHSGSRWLTFRLEFLNCIRVDSNQLPVRQDFPSTGSDRENYEMEKHYRFDGGTCGARNGEEYVRIPGLEFNVQWEIQDNHANQLQRGGWTFSNGTGWDDVAAARSGAQPDQRVSEVQLPGLHGDYMAAWVDNDSLFSEWPTDTNDQDSSSTDAMSLLTKLTRDFPNDFLFGVEGSAQNEFNNLNEVRDDTRGNDSRLSVSGGKHTGDRSSLLTGQLTVPALNNAPREVGAGHGDTGHDTDNDGQDDGGHDDGGQDDDAHDDDAHDDGGHDDDAHDNDGQDDTLPTHDPNGRIYCSSPAVDPDGDGWGWENNGSCVVR